MGGPTVVNDDPAPPTFPEAYTAAGYILLPYANLTEPFTANYDANQNKSRIDYYNGTMKTFQINAPYANSPKGAAFKVRAGPENDVHRFPARPSTSYLILPLHLPTDRVEPEPLQPPPREYLLSEQRLGRRTS